MALKADQPSSKANSPKVEKASVIDMFSSEKTSTVPPSAENETISQ